VGRKSNSDYIKHTQEGEVKHASILYHAKQSFFIAGVSRRVSHEMIRNYVGSDRNEEGSPSQESTRYTHHPGHFVVNPRDIAAGEEAIIAFAEDMNVNYGRYLAYINREVSNHKARYGEEPKGMDRKRIYEAASGRLSHSCETSWLWTSNPVAIAKFMHERENEAADLGINRLAMAWRKEVMANAPNLYPQPWMNKP
jgi:thymidylate synthase ThyX